jgi:hypothetical protein
MIEYPTGSVRIQYTTIYVRDSSAATSHTSWHATDKPIPRWNFIKIPLAIEGEMDTIWRKEHWSVLAPTRT